MTDTVGGNVRTWVLGACGRRRCTRGATLPVYLTDLDDVGRSASAADGVGGSGA